ncbi:MAG: deacylase [Planctomycetota bacterium]|nr:MAG: deacylase [Planctomycetota bacterium]
MLPSRTPLTLPVAVRHGARPGPRLWLSASIHGDEANGIEIVRRVLARVEPARLAGALIALPIVNVFGFLAGSRYLPDRRDLNRSFPGSPQGSLAARLAHLIMREIVANCTHGIDLHTGSNRRENLPQIRAVLEDDATRRLAEAFGAPVVVNARTRDGSLREAATRRGRTVLVYEAGETLRFSPEAIRIGVAGVLRAMRAIGMGSFGAPRPARPPLRVDRSRWIRARRSGVARLEVRLGARVRKGQPLGDICDGFGARVARITASVSGIVIGINNNPLVHQGDALVHVGEAARPTAESTDIKGGRQRSG